MKKILIVEDHEDTREMLRFVLAMEDYHVLEARTGEEALEIAFAEKPDLILMDVSLSGSQLDGLEATRRLRRDRQFDRTIIVALTAHALKSDGERILKSGCDYYWKKPIENLIEFQRSVAAIISDKTAPSE